MSSGRTSRALARKDWTGSRPSSNSSEASRCQLWTAPSVMPTGSITTTNLSSGSADRTLRTLLSCAAVETAMPFDPESRTMYSISGSRSVG